MTPNPDERILYRLIIDNGPPVPAVSSYRAVRNAIAAITIGARDVRIESRSAILSSDGKFIVDLFDDWDLDTASMEILESELLHQAAGITPAQSTLTLPVALRQLSNACDIIEKNLKSSSRDELTHTEVKTLANAIQKVIFLIEQEEVN